MKKRVMTLFLALVMCVGLSVPAMAADSDFTIENGVLKKYNGPGGAVTIPDGVTSIGSGAFSERTDITSVTIPDGVTSIGNGAFYRCTRLATLNMPTSVTSIGDNAFSLGRPLDTINYGGTKVQWEAIKIGTDNSSLVHAVCIVWGTNQPGTSGSANNTCGAGLTWTYDRNSKTLTISGTGSMADYSFESPAPWYPEATFNCTTVMIHEGVTCIGDNAFANFTELTKVTIPGSVASIGDNAFANNRRLPDIVIPNGVTSIGFGAFTACVSLSNVSLPDSVNSIGMLAFYDCQNIDSITIPGSVTQIEKQTFDGCLGLSSVVIPKGITSIGGHAFSRCSSLKDVYFSGTGAEWNTIPIGAYNDPLLSATIHYNSDGSGRSDPPVEPPLTTGSTASPTNDALTINGTAATPAAYKIDGANYFKLRDVAALLSGTGSQFSADWDAAAKAASITPGQPYVRQPTDLQGKPTVSATANLSKDVIYINGRQADLTIYKIGDNNYIKLRDLGVLLDFFVGYENGTMVIDTSRPYSK